MMRMVTSGILAILVGLAGPATAGPPTDQLKGAVDRVLAVLQDPGLKPPERAEARRRQIRTVADEVFDWKETGKRALGRHWQPLSPAQRAEFSTLFADLIERSYVGKIEAYSGERILYLGEAVEGSEATVRTKLVTKSNTEIPIEYRMSKDGDRWRAYDVTIEGVSLVSNYRTQFNRIIAQSGYEELVRKMKTKQEELVYQQGAPRKPTP